MAHDSGHHSDTTHDLPHEGPIKTPKQLAVAVAFSFIVPILAIILLVTYVTRADKAGAGSDGQSEQAIARRLAPVGTVVVKDASDPSKLATGEQVYAAQCAACHTSGAAGAPKLGDTAAWASRIKSGAEQLLTAALKGKGSMPAQGGGDYTDLEISRAVVYMANKSGGTLPEYKMPATPTADAQAAPAAAGDPAAAADAKAAVAAALAGAAPKAGEAAPAADGKAQAIYAQACQVCHAAGVANAPKLGDKAAWAPRLAQGIDGLTASVIKGKGAMPARGGSTASDAELKAVVAYMVGTVK